MPSLKSQIFEARYGEIQKKLHPGSSSEKVSALVDQYRSGTPVKVLAEQFGIPRQTVLRHAQRAGVAQRR